MRRQAALLGAALLFAASFWALTASANINCDLPVCLPTGSSSPSPSPSPSPSSSSSSSSSSSTTATSTSSTSSTSSSAPGSSGGANPSSSGAGLGTDTGGVDDLLGAAGSLDPGIGGVPGGEPDGGDNAAPPPDEADDGEPTVPWLGAKLLVVALALMGFSFGVIWYLQGGPRRRKRGPGKGSTGSGSLWRKG